MRLADPETADLSADPGAIDAIPDRPAVFRIGTGGQPYVGRTAFLRRRLRTLFRRQSRGSRLLALGDLAGRIDYWLTGSRLESSLVLYELVRLEFPEDYLKRLKLRSPAYLKVLTGNVFPRTQVTTRLAGRDSYFYGPFASRAGAERFESDFLDLFSLRRCVEDLTPAPDHPGCVYGEMGRCLRPCQEVVGPEEYRSEVDRALRFLTTQGGSLEVSLREARDRLSAELQFEDAARVHKRWERIGEIQRQKDELAAAIERQFGVAVTPSAREGAVVLWFFAAGEWLAPVVFDWEESRKRPTSMDSQLREIAAGLTTHTLTAEERHEGFALLAKWYYSSWRDGVWLGFSALDQIPYRRAVRALSQIASGRKQDHTADPAGSEPAGR